MSLNYIEGNLAIQRLVESGDRARRRFLAWRAVRRVAPPAAALALATAAWSALGGAPRFAGPILLVNTAAATAVMFFLMRRRRPSPEAVVAELDRAAALGGALRSAHWFASAPDRIPSDERAARWIAFHIEMAGRRTEHVNWTALYPRPPLRAPALLTAALAAATFALSGMTPVRVSTHAAAVSVRPSPAAPPDGDSLPPALAADIVEGVRAMRAGEVPSAAALSAIGRALEIVKANPATSGEMQTLLARAAGGQPVPDDWLDPDRDPRLVNDDLLPLEWGYQEALARRAESEARRGAPGSGLTERSRETAGAEAGVDPTSGSRVRGDGRGQPAGFTSLLFGRQAAAGDDRTGQPRTSAAPSETLAAALRREVISARADVPLALDPLAERRSTTPGTEPGGAIRAEMNLTYDREAAVRPPAVPSARRPLVRGFFDRKTVQ